MTSALFIVFRFRFIIGGFSFACMNTLFLLSVDIFSVEWIAIDELEEVQTAATPRHSADEEDAGDAEDLLAT